VDVSKGIDWGVLPGPFYNPEMGFGIGGQRSGLYKPKSAEAETQLSAVDPRLRHGQGGLRHIGRKQYLLCGRQLPRLIEADLINMPTACWGIDYNNAIDSANKEAYTRQTVALQPDPVPGRAERLYRGWI
jgi:hypothetical protein